MARWLPGLISLVLACLILAACGGAPAAPTPWAKSTEPAKPAPLGEPGATTSRPLPVEPAKPAAEPTRPAAAPSGGPRSDGSGSEPRSAPAAAPTTGPGAAAKPAAATTSPASAERSRGAPAPAEPAASSDAAAHPCSSCPAPTPPPYRPTAAPYPPHQPPLRDPLRAGAVDDNARFDEYQHYLRTYRGPAAWPVDVSERYLIAVSDADQRPVANSLVRVYHGQQVVFTGRTYAGGLTVFHPLATPDAVQATEFTITAEKDGRFANQSVQRGGGGQWSLTLNGPAVRSPLVRLDLLFLIDSTGSMGGEIAKIQATLASIADRITRLPGQPQIRFGGVTYRDRGDQYVVKRFGFTEDAQEFQRWLNGIRAGGGGDYPESLNEALHIAVSEMDWDGRDAVRLVFLVADAPPHLDYSNDYHYPTEAVLAVTKGIKLYTIGASGLQPQGEYVFRQLAQQTLAQYLFITRGGDSQSGGGPVSATNIQSPENNLDDIVVKIVAQEVRQLA